MKKEHQSWNQHEPSVPWGIRTSLLLLVGFVIIQFTIAFIVTLIIMLADSEQKAMSMAASGQFTGLANGIGNLVAFGMIYIVIKGAIKDRFTFLSSVSLRPFPADSWIVSAIGGAILLILLFEIIGHLLNVLPIPKLYLGLFNSPFDAMIMIAFTVAAAVTEETLHRGVLFPAVASRYGTWIGVGASTFIFGALYLISYESDWIAILHILMMGAFYSFLRAASKSTWPSIIAFSIIGIYTILRAISMGGMLPDVPVLLTTTPTPTSIKLPPNWTPTLHTTITPSPTYIPTSTSRPPSTPTKTYPPSSTNTLTPTVNPAVDVALQIDWADDIDPLFLPEQGYEDVLWSPNANEILYTDCYNGGANITKAIAPDFSPVVLAKQSICEDVIWSPDGQYILYFGYPTDLWMMKSDGSDAHPLNLNASLWYPRFEGWMDNQRLIYSSYSGGGNAVISVIDIMTGQELARQAFHGSINLPNEKYIPVFYDTVDSSFQYHLGAIEVKSSLPDVSADTFDIIPFPDYNSIPLTQTKTLFQDWLPNTNQMLVSWEYYSSEWEIGKWHLLLWDIDHNMAKVIAPNAILGNYSPDGRFLAYKTYGPAKLDVDGVPIDDTNLAPVNLLAEDTRSEYLQILNVENGQVNLSLPTIPWTKTAFSPNGQYLSFLTLGEIQTDNNGWPETIPAQTNPVTHTNVLDLWSGKLLFSLQEVSTLPVWSPDSKNFLYQDRDGNLDVINIVRSSSRALTYNMSASKIDSYNWSHDGQYLVVFVGAYGVMNSGVIIKVP